jgi:signal peptidase I
MKKIVIVVVGLGVSWALFAPPLADFERIVKGDEGRYGDIKVIEDIFNRQAFDELPAHYDGYRQVYKSGEWIHVISSDSHHGGGTTGVLESNGKRHFYFGHVCGSGEGIPVDYGDIEFDPDQKQNGNRLLKIR